MKIEVCSKAFTPLQMQQVYIHGLPNSASYINSSVVGGASFDSPVRLLGPVTSSRPPSAAAMDGPITSSRPPSAMDVRFDEEVCSSLFVEKRRDKGTCLSDSLLDLCGLCVQLKIVTAQPPSRHRCSCCRRCARTASSRACSSLPSRTSASTRAWAEALSLGSETRSTTG